MNSVNHGSKRTIFIALALLIAMWLTRSHHFASLDVLPDVSWAAFFIAGLFAAGWLVAAGLMLNAGLIDYLALLGGVSDYCVTPAYPFLIPTYLTLWAAGRWAGMPLDLHWRSLLRVATACVLGVPAAFVISNASFYAFAGYFADMSAFAYMLAVAGYFPAFLESTALYSLVALVVAKGLDAMGAQQKNIRVTR